MTSNRFLWIAMLVLAGLTGCAMCDNSEDRTYPAFGGKWQRDNPVSGRVGSLFDPAGGQVTEQVTLTEAGPMLPEAETDETAAGAVPSEDAAPSEGAEPTEGVEEAPESMLDKPAKQDAPAMDEAETTEPETAEQAEPAAQAKPSAPDAPNAGLQLPALPGEMPKTEDPKEGSTNLLPPLELPPQP